MIGFKEYKKLIYSLLHLIFPTGDNQLVLLFRFTRVQLYIFDFAGKGIFPVQLGRLTPYPLATPAYIYKFELIFYLMF